MGRIIRILHLDSDPDTTWLLHQHLRHRGARYIVQRVATLAEFARALDEGQWHAILSDFRSPAASAADALSFLRTRDIDVPFVVLSSRLEEPEIAGIMHAGADDCVDKDDLARLVPVLDREFRRHSPNRTHGTAAG